jgi:anaerobic carbon-monoxide dehydrogenase iron sulfur subunit
MRVTPWAIDESRCTGCRSCVLACSFVHTGSFFEDGSLITVRRDAEHGRAAPRVCIGCDSAACIASCPANALFRDTALGVVKVASTLCTGCRRCVDACPHGGVQFGVADSVPRFCNLCGGDPVCVKYCRFPQAIQWKPQEAQR